MPNETKMGRPKTVKNGVKLNVYVDREIKRALFAMATDRRMSISAVVRDLVLASRKPVSTPDETLAGGVSGTRTATTQNKNHCLSHA